MKTLRDYQQIAYQRAVEANTLVADDRGLGKTVTAIEAAKKLIHEIPGPALIVVPKTLREQWIEEIKDQDPNTPLVLIDTSTRLPQPFDSRKAFWVVIHYEGLLKHHKMLSKTFWGTIVADEAHRIKNRKAQRAIAIKTLQAYRKIALTGTPYDRNPADIWSILNWLRPDIFKSYWNFFEAHVNYTGDIAGAKEIHGVRDGAKFGRVIAPYTIQRSKHDVAPSLPPKIEQYIPVQMTKLQADLYRRIKELAETDLLLDTGEELVIKNHLGRILRLQQAAVDPRLLGTSEDGAKIEWLRDYIDDNPAETLLIFTRFRDTAIRVAHMLEIPYYVGGEDSLNGTALADHPRFVATIDAAKEGLNLGHIWNSVFLDSHWSSIAMAQAIDRTERDLTATQPRVIMYLQAVDAAGNPTVDNLVRAALAGKWSTVTLVNEWLRRIQAERENS